MSWDHLSSTDVQAYTCKTKFQTSTLLSTNDLSAAELSCDKLKEVEIAIYESEICKVCMPAYCCHQHSSLIVLMNAKADGSQILEELSKNFLRVPIRNQLEKADGIIFSSLFVL